MRSLRLLTMGLVLAAMASTADAQVLGTFRWQLQPYCNVVTLVVTQQGAQYQLDGTDDQCGAGLAATRGLAYVNSNGTVGFGFVIITTPGGLPVHVDANIGIPSLNGTWKDSAGHSGTFVFTPGPSLQGPTRPAAPAGAGPVKAASFVFGAIPSTATLPTNGPDFAPITFTAPLTGTAIADATGYCIVNSIANLPSSSTLTVAVDGATLPTPQVLAYAAVLSMPSTASVTTDTKPWAVQREFPVVAGTTYTASVRAWHSAGPTASVTCSGNVNVRVHAGVLP